MDQPSENDLTLDDFCIEVLCLLKGMDQPLTMEQILSLFAEGIEDKLFEVRSWRRYLPSAFTKGAFRLIYGDNVKDAVARLQEEGLIYAKLLHPKGESPWAKDVPDIRAFVFWKKRRGTLAA